jgi:hypothetical protein
VCMRNETRREKETTCHSVTYHWGRKSGVEKKSRGGRGEKEKDRVRTRAHQPRHHGGPFNHKYGDKEENRRCRR